MDGKPPRIYATSRAFEAALKAKLLPRITRVRTFTVLRKEVAFDRFLARVHAAAPDAWLLKGGVALEFRLPDARPTNDVDISVRIGTRHDEIIAMLHAAANHDLEDYLRFSVGEPQAISEEINVCRFLLEARLGDNRPFEKFKVDVGFGDAWIGEPETLTGSAILTFAGIRPAEVKAIPLEQHLAEKLHAYVRSRGDRANTRVKDLVDMALLVEHSPFAFDRLREALDVTFTSRGPHGVPKALPPPPHDWATSYARLAEDLPVPQMIDGAHRHVAAILNPILARYGDLESGRTGR